MCSATPTPEQALLAFFQRVATRDPEQLRALGRHPGFDFASGCWQFRIPDLYAYLQRHEPGFEPLGYSQFRKLLFGCPVNRSIAPFGAEVVIAENHGKVDRSVYALVWNPTPDPDGSEE